MAATNFDNQHFEKFSLEPEVYMQVSPNQWGASLFIFREVEQTFNGVQSKLLKGRLDNATVKAKVN